MLVGKRNGTATSEDSLTVSYKVLDSGIIRSSDWAPKYLPKWVENYCPHRNLYIRVYSSVIHNCQKLEATKISTKVGEINCGTSDNEILFSEMVEHWEFLGQWNDSAWYYNDRYDIMHLAKAIPIYNTNSKP